MPTRCPVRRSPIQGWFIQFAILRARAISPVPAIGWPSSRNSENKDQALRHITLAQVRAGNADGAIADAGTLTDAGARAYLFLDIAALLGARQD